MRPRPAVATFLCAFLLGLPFAGCAQPHNDNGAPAPPDESRSANTVEFLRQQVKLQGGEGRGTKDPITLPSDTLCTLPRSVPIRVVPPSRAARAGDSLTYMVEVDPPITGTQSFLVAYTDTTPFSLFNNVITGTNGQTLVPLNLTVRADAPSSVVLFWVRNACNEGKADSLISIGVTP